MSTHPVFSEFNGVRTRIGTANQAEDGSFVIVLGGFLVVGAAEGPSRSQSNARPTSSGGSGMCLPNYGRQKGQPIAGADLKALEFYAGGCVRSLDNPEKARWHDRERELLAAINAEIQRQGGTPVHVNAQEEYGQPPPMERGPRDEQDDIPFSQPSGASTALA